uniref:uncharacterized protein LOC113474411 n=1 Tax=Ciona intestinalis TaxID=7719 RepID=UPI000EF49684|nr:uncharacterized protein LOC113474411 [Ciona intestinalis]|eukprot:XP_026691166.1 uncharacterized protein LOC113474411 [Ciona intestinalis]
MMCDCIFFLLQQIVPLTYTNRLCTTALRILGPTLFPCCLAFVYVFLMVRQHRLQSKAVLKSLLPTWLKKLHTVAFLVTFLTVTYPVFFAWIPIYSGEAIPMAYYDNGSCYQTPTAKNPAFPFFPTVIPVIYIYLFYKILRVHGKNTENLSVSNKRMDNTLRRCLVFSSICITTDLICSMGMVYATNVVPMEIPLLFARIDSFLNLVCLLFCFKSTSLHYLASCMARATQSNTKVQQIRIENSRAVSTITKRNTTEDI